MNRLAVILGNDGKTVATHEIPSYSSYWDVAKKSYNNYISGEMEIVEIPANLAEYRKETNRNTGANVCLLNAVEKYFEHLLGLKLHYTDGDFFKNHPLVTKDGVAAGDTLQIVQELIAPYGIGISRARVMPGFFPMGDMSQWLDVLGVNPMALGNYSVSNRHFSKQTGLPLTEADNQFRFDFSEEALRPAIVCGVREGTWQDKKSGRTGSYNLAHAEYCAPRHAALAGDMMQLQLLPVSQLVWKKLPVFAPLKASFIETLEFSLMDCKTSGGKSLWQLVPKSEHKGNSIWPWKRKEGHQSYSGMSSRICVGCKETRKPKHLIPESGYMVCNPCWVLAWSKFVCPKCRHQFGKGAPKYLGALSSQQKKLIGKCLKCSKLVQLSAEDNKAITPIVDGVLEARKKDGKDEPPADYKAFD